MLLCFDNFCSFTSSSTQRLFCWYIWLWLNSDCVWKAGAQLQKELPQWKDRSTMHKTPWTRRGEQKNFVAWMWLIVQDRTCLMEMAVCSHRRWVWLTPTIRSVAEVWTGARTRYQDQTTTSQQAAICSTFLPLDPLRELKYCKCNTLPSKDQSQRCSVWQQSHCCGPTFLQQLRHVCPPFLEITLLAVGEGPRGRFLHYRCSKA